MAKHLTLPLQMAAQHQTGQVDVHAFCAWVRTARMHAAGCVNSSAYIQT